MGATYKKRFGRQGEIFAAEILKEMGFVILAKNYRCYQGEIDIIARRGKEIHFVEVKTRFGSGNGRPEESVTEKKVKAMKGAAGYFMNRIGDSDHKGVFDVMAVEVEFIENCI